uniref:Acetyl-CoA acetyltransferase 2 n=1 Tax=Leptinotarsa decemlineata TaxID=7539 RepID=A0A141NZA3_LEPDE|nr:acetyl-CoA acetyltransferase, cytosolic [Leptinotarsa decemlineata]AMB37467.1 acetyl-CoA acetyltransferase 2 [Leptinotarsa decemlineata]
MDKVYIISACRTPIGSFQGQFEKFSASELGAIAISESIRRAKLNPEDVEHIIMGQVLTAGQGQNPARQAAIGAKIPNTSPSYTVNMLCGSGLKSVALGFQAIRNGDYGIVIAGGQESMTRAQHSAYLRGCKLGQLNLSDTLLSDGLTDAFNKDVHMGNTAEHLSKLYSIPREDQDKYACQSQNKTEEAIKNGFFTEEIIGVPEKRTKKLLDKDEFPRFGTTVETLTKLKPCFISNGTVTPGNASGINDGAAALVLANESVVNSKHLIPLAKVLAFAEVGVDPMCMGTGPIGAVTNVLKKVGWSKEDVDLYELNEAFAVQSIVVNKMLEIDEAKVNITGGAIAMGHPIGCSGARVLVTLIHNLKRTKKSKGVAALCIGGGMGIAMAIEMC